MLIFYGVVDPRRCRWGIECCPLRGRSWMWGLQNFDNGDSGAAELNMFVVEVD